MQGKSSYRQLRISLYIRGMMQVLAVIFIRKFVTRFKVSFIQFFLFIRNSVCEWFPDRKLIFITWPSCNNPVPETGTRGQDCNILSPVGWIVWASLSLTNFRDLHSKSIIISVVFYVFPNALFFVRLELVLYNFFLQLFSFSPVL